MTCPYGTMPLKIFHFYQINYCNIIFFLQAPPEYLLSAAVMSAPAAIAVAKINYPETEVSVTMKQEDIKLERGSVSFVHSECQFKHHPELRSQYLIGIQNKHTKMYQGVCFWHHTYKVR